MANSKAGQLVDITQVGGDDLNLSGGRIPVTAQSAQAIQCYSFIADGTDELLIDATARKLWGVDVFTIDATPVYVKLYDKATAPASTDTPIHRTGTPSNAIAANGSGNNKGIWPAYIPLTSGLGVRAVVGLADSDNTALTAAENIINVYWSA